MLKVKFNLYLYQKHSYLYIIIINLKIKIMKVVFKNEENESLFVVTKNEAKNLVLPKKGEGIIWMKLYMFVDLVEHNYDTKEITVFVKVQ